MRIIGGRFKGRTLVTVKGNSVRPTTDRVKESIFNLIQDSIPNARVLDLFAGSGALGIEAISRGAKSAVFADNSRDSVNALKENLKKIDGKTEILMCDFKSAVHRLTGDKFDVIFLDPPYEKGFDSRALAEIIKEDILADGGIIVLERKRGGEAYEIPKDFEETDARDYGSVTVHILERATKAAVTGTFDPFTNGHLYLVEKALEAFDRVHVVVLINPDKEMTYGLEKRMSFIEKAVKPYGKRVKIRNYDGLAIDYCNKNGIEYIVRGFRNPKDYEYESQMAAYNKENGNVTTLLIPAKDQISSTLVKERLRTGGDITGMVSGNIAKELKSGGVNTKWKT